MRFWDYWLKGPSNGDDRVDAYLSTVPNMHDVPVLHDIVFPFEAQRPLGAGVGFGACFQQLIPANCLSADEVFFEVGVNRSGGVLCSRVHGNCPGTAFVFSGGKERN